ncbi:MULTISPECIES: hypothetical protein [Pseudomonas]|uniref:hypothetical protein n=1 Tax=Pseudomonas TaxID=286 RepID=UPI0012FD4B4B|nr:MULTISPECIES: hypothetical protein [Pseudomonas]
MNEPEYWMLVLTIIQALALAMLMLNSARHYCCCSGAILQSVTHASFGNIG